MTVSDSLLVKMIEQDMARLGVTNYELEHHTVDNPSFIPVAVNEMVYVCYVSLEFYQWDFNLHLQSATESADYNVGNMTPYFHWPAPEVDPLAEQQQLQEPDWYDYQSNRITKHRGNITCKHSLPEMYSVVSYCRVIMHPSKD